MDFIICLFFDNRSNTDNTLLETFCINHHYSTRLSTFDELEKN